MPEMSDLRAVVPADLKAELRSILALERMTITQWLIAQMQRTVNEARAPRRLGKSYDVDR